MSDPIDDIMNAPPRLTVEEVLLLNNLKEFLFTEPELNAVCVVHTMLKIPLAMVIDAGLTAILENEE